MNTCIMALAAMAGIMAVDPATAQSSGGATMFAGHWRVTGVAVSGDGVQALSDNDPSYMGKGLTFSAARLAWDLPTTTNDACTNPMFTRLNAAALNGFQPQLRKLGMPNPTPFAIHCQSGTWGPGNAVIFRGAAGAVALPWYDGGMLKLSRR